MTDHQKHPFEDLLSAENDFFERQVDEIYRNMYPAADVRPRPVSFELPRARLRVTIRRLRVRLAVVVAGYDFTNRED